MLVCPFDIFDKQLGAPNFHGRKVALVSNFHSAHPVGVYKWNCLCVITSKMINKLLVGFTHPYNQNKHILKAYDESYSKFNKEHKDKDNEKDNCKDKHTDKLTERLYMC